MNFFNSVFSEDTTPPDSPKSPTFDNPNPNSESPPQRNLPAWSSFNSLIQTIATKSESMIETYRKDFQDFGSGLKKETDVIRQVASRAVHDLPASLEASAAVAQVSLESVGQAIDDIGSTVWNSTAHIISHGRDSLLAIDHGHDLNSSDNDSNNSYVLIKRKSLNVKYSRFDAQVRALQCDLDTYCSEPEDKEDYDKWRLQVLVIEEKRDEIESLISEDGPVSDNFKEVVPGRVDNESFWNRYFYRMFKLKQAEEARLLLVKRAISGEEEDLSWDFDDEEEEEGNGFLLKGESSVNVKPEKENFDDSNNEKIAEKEKVGVDRGEDKSEEEEAVVVDGRGDNGGSCKDSDVSVVSAQSLPEGEDLGWDEIEDMESNGENKGEALGSTKSAGTSRVDLHKQLSAAEEEEDLSWDIEDEDEVHVN